ncbi:nucleotidyltransferase family protein [Anaerosolibacter sp.]|uniref:nucleotidyltransferase family protein n=1 Tax=Anaerosolibacter sp. TaxID=1872527 RepID=UPI0039F005BF
MYTDVKRLTVNNSISLKDALKKMDDEAKGILLVVDQQNKLIGTLTDGDLRRAILKDYRLEEKIEEIIHENPISANVYMNRDEIKDIFIRKAIRHLPITDETGVICDLISINDILLEKGKDNAVIIMAGGLGTRLRDLTKEIPKPMLKVGQYPILHHIINNFKQYGCNKMFISVNYKSEIIENYFQDGYAHGVKINYVKEHKRLGTGGGIRLAKEYIQKPFFVINGDIFTNVNLEEMMNFHENSGYDITVGTRKHSYKIPYGVINTEGHQIIDIQEKPEIDYLINAGIYCLNPAVIDYIPEDEYFEITDLINTCIQQNHKIGSYEIKDYWMDIGQVNDYYRVNEEYEKMLSQID